MNDRDNGVALVVGVGAGLGAALGRRFAAGGMEVAVASRDLGRSRALAKGIGAHAYACDATDEAQVGQLFRQVEGELGTPSLVVYNASGFMHRSVLEIDTEELVEAWKVDCLGGFLVGREAARLMVDRGGTVIFTGATACYKGSAKFAGFAIGKFGLRALAQSMARELGPRKVHVAIVNIDGEINGPAHAHEIPEKGIESLLDPDAIAETYWALHRQHPTAWTHELDIRPAIERW